MGMAIDTSYPYPPADLRRWGPGWPNCQTDEIVPLHVNGVDFPGGVHWRVKELFARFLRESENRGYVKLRKGWCWGFACRPIKNADGTLTNTPSNHSWGLAIDVNAPENVYGSETFKIPADMGRLANKYGIAWGGDYPNTKDAMHFEFVGTPRQAASMLALARQRNLGEKPTTYTFAGRRYSRVGRLLRAIKRRLGLVPAKGESVNIDLEENPRG